MNATDASTSALQRLRTLVEGVTDHGATEADQSRLWEAYVLHLGDDAVHLHGPDVAAMLPVLRSVGRGWGQRVDEVRRAAREARRAARELEVLEGGPAFDAEPEVWDKLQRRSTDEGEVARAHVLNAMTILREDTRWRGRVRFNAFTLRPEFKGEPFADHDVTSFQAWCINSYGVDFGVTNARNAMLRVARDEANTYHPVRDYLGSLTWDGKDRLDFLLPDYFQTEDEPLNRILGRRWLIGCVARVMDPGCQLDTVLVLEGKQGQFKSTGIRVLAGDGWYRDTRLDPHSKDMYSAIQGAWLYEIPEFEQWLGWREQSVIKAIITSRRDVYRRAYAAFEDEQPRQCVFVGTTNQAQYLQDETGSRRFWPARLEAPVRVEELRRDRDQLWAEAVHRYNGGEQWHLTEEEGQHLADASSEREVERPQEVAIARWAADKTGFTTLEAVNGALNMAVATVQGGHAKAVATALRKVGFERSRDKHGAREWRWHRAR